MKNTANAERPMSAMVYWPSRSGPVRWSGRPAQTVFSSAIRDSRAVTAPSGQRSYRVARQNRHTRSPEPRNAADCCIFDSPGGAWRDSGDQPLDRRVIQVRESFAFRTADLAVTRLHETAP